MALHSSVVSSPASATSSAVSALYEQATERSALQPVRSSAVSAQLEASSDSSAVQPESFRLCSLPQPDTSSFSSLVMPLRSSAVIWLPHASSSRRFVNCSMPVRSAIFVIFVSSRSMHCTASHSAAESLPSPFVSQCPVTYSRSTGSGKCAASSGISPAAIAGTPSASSIMTASSRHSVFLRCFIAVPPVKDSRTWDL